MAITAIFHSHGWRRRLFAAGLGIFATAALPPIFLVPFLIPSFSGLFLLILNASDAKQAFWDGWWWGLGFFTSGLYWICISLFVEPDKFAWLTPFALFGLPSIIAIYTGLASYLLFICQRKGVSRGRLLIVFPVLWIAIEYARAHLFTGFPWNLTGYALNVTTHTLQMAHFWGIYGQSWFCVQLAILPVLFVLAHPKAKLLNFFGAFLFIAVTIFGGWRLAQHPTEYSAYRLRIVQANIAQSLKFDPREMVAGLKKHITLMHEEGLEKINMVVWPETALPYLVDDYSPLLTDIGRTLPEQTLLFTGGMHAEGEKKEMKAWNAAFIINTQGKLLATYDKHHLVPFGEYIPFRNILPLEAIANGMGDFERGPGPMTITAEGVPPFSPLICYEAIFPGKVVQPHTSPRWLANITNDAWFGISTGPYQHMEMSRTRAVEEGLPLIRAANTGISVVVDAYGRILQSLPLGQQGIIDTALPLPVH